MFVDSAFIFRPEAYRANLMRVVVGLVGEWKMSFLTCLSIVSINLYL